MRAVFRLPVSVRLDVATAKTLPLLAEPATVTTTLPVVAPAGTGTVMLLSLQVVGVAVAPLNVTVLVPCVAPKFAPAIVTNAPTGAPVGVTAVIDGGDCAAR
jgi:hypothetical protein